ncbi:MAG: AAA family ATPase, partial [Verrucomicrobia bacterium]|nr:AAA family ATPase [Verrucomicrobiota bacterium]
MPASAASPSVPDNEAIVQASSWVAPLRTEIARVLVGQNMLVDRLLVALLTNGHVLLEGVPGLAKTLAVRTLAGTLQAKFQRIQFTPDLLPADVIGTMVYHPKDGTFTPRLGPIFANLVLADEINRA